MQIRLLIDHLIPEEFLVLSGEQRRKARLIASLGLLGLTVIPIYIVHIQNQGYEKFTSWLFLIVIFSLLLQPLILKISKSLIIGPIISALLIIITAPLLMLGANGLASEHTIAWPITLVAFSYIIGLKFGFYYLLAQIVAIAVIAYSQINGYISPNPFTTTLTLSSVLSLVICQAILYGFMWLFERNRTENESALIEKEANLRSVVDTAADGIISIDANGIIELFNPAAERIFGYEGKNIIGSKANILLSESFYGVFENYLHGGSYPQKNSVLVSGREVEGQRKNREFFPMELTASEINVDGKRKYTCIVRDISKHKQAQKELIRQYENLKIANESLKSAQSQLLQSEKMAAIGQLSAGIAHEINNPVGYICSNLASLELYVCDLLKLISAYEETENGLSDVRLLDSVKNLKQEIEFNFLKIDIMELIQETEEGVSRVRKIVKDLKDFSHIDEADWQWSDIHTGIDSTLNVVNNEIKYKAKVVKEYGELPEIKCLISQLNQVFMNLLINAAQAMDDSGQGSITIRTWTERNGVSITFMDTGKGMDEATMKRVFEPFYTTKPVGEGTGLGLSLTYGIIEKHQGSITVDSKEGKGTTFKIWLPIQACWNEVKNG